MSARDVIDQLLKKFEDGKLTREETLAEVLGVCGSMDETDSGGREGTFIATGTNHLALGATDLDRAREFYTRTFGMKVLRHREEYLFLDMPYGFLGFFRRDEAAMDHFCLSVRDYDADTARRRLEELGREVNRPPGSDRVYFTDPEGYKVQLAAWEFKS